MAVYIMNVFSMFLKTSASIYCGQHCKWVYDVLNTHIPKSSGMFFLLNHCKIRLNIPKCPQCVLVDGCPPLEHFPKSLILHGEIGTPLFTYNNFFIHVPQCLQEFDGMKVCPFHIDSLWLWSVRDVILALPLHLASTICTTAPLVILRATWIRHSAATATNGRLALGMTEKHQLKGRVKESQGRRTDFASVPAELFPPVDFTSETTNQCHLQNVSVPAVAAQSQDVSGRFETTGLSDAKRQIYAHVKSLHAIHVAIFVSTLPSCSMSAWGCFGMYSVFFAALSASSRELNLFVVESHFWEFMLYETHHVTSTRDWLACMPVDRGKSWEPAQIFLISSRTVSIWSYLWHL